LKPWRTIVKATASSNSKWQTGREAGTQSHGSAGSALPGKARIARPPKLQPKSEVASAELLTQLARSTSDEPVYHAS
jgi:hypothetical protein